MSIAQAFDSNDALGLAELVRTKAVTARELLDEALRRADALNPKLNAVVVDMRDEARRLVEAGLPEGPLLGVPFLLKELAQPYAGVPLRNSSRAYETYVPKAHGELTRRYLAAGLVPFGKTSSSEWGILPTTEPLRYGPCHNPWRLGTTPGGSSGGAAAVVAARVVPVAHGGDAGGSIRIPAACCGVFGLKPTRGRNPYGPDSSERVHGLAQEHVLSVSVRDSAAFLDASAGPELTAPYWAPPRTVSYLAETKRPPGKLRIAWTHQPILPADANADAQRAVEDAVKLLTELGHECVEARPNLDSHALAAAFFTTYCAGVAGELQVAARHLGRPARQDDVEPTTWLMGMIGRTRYSAGDFSLALRDLQASSREVHRFMQGCDVFLTPTLGKPPVPHGTLGPQGLEKRAQELAVRLDATAALKLPGLIEKAIARAYGFVPYTALQNVTGQPSMSVPLWWTADGLPFGVCFSGRFGDEATLFRLAAQLEQARPWKDRRPAHCVAPA